MPASAARSRSTKRRSTSKRSAGRKCSSVRSRSRSRSAASKSKRAPARKRVGRSKRRSSAARRRSSARRSRSTYGRRRSASGHRGASSRSRSSSRAQRSRKVVDAGKKTRGRSVLRTCASSKLGSKMAGTGRGRSVTWAREPRKIPSGKSRSSVQSSSRATALRSSSASQGAAEPKKKGPCYAFAAFVKEQLTNTSIAKGTLCATMRCLAARWALLTPEQKERYRKMARELSAANQASSSATQKRVAGKRSSVQGSCGGRRTTDDISSDEDED